MDKFREIIAPLAQLATVIALVVGLTIWLIQVRSDSGQTEFQRGCNELDQKAVSYMTRPAEFKDTIAAIREQSRLRGCHVKP